jgi:myb proto-oncogene protein
MKGKLNYYLASGRLEQITDLKEDISVPESSQSDIPKDSQGSSESNRPPSYLPPRPKSKSDLSELDENADTSEEESSDCIYPKGLDAHSAKVSKKIMSKSKQRARARKKLDFLSTPVELKVCTAAASCQRPPLKMEQTTPASDNNSPSDECQGIPQNAASEPVDVVIPTAASNHPNDVHSLANPDICSLEIQETDASDLLDMSYCDGLMIDSPPYLHGSSFI